MKLLIKINLVMGAVFAAGLAIAGVLSYKLLENNAQNEVIQQARIMMHSAQAVRAYTVNEVKPLLDEGMKKVFLPQSVPAYAATQNFNSFRKQNPEYSYKEATLNPTNPRDRATDWEADVVRYFRDKPDAKELIGKRDTPTGPSVYLALPLQIKNPDCLACHSVPSAAPKTMMKLYGNDNGFGWKLQEIIGAQIVSVPTSLAVQKANSAFYLFISALLLIFLVMAAMFNSMMYFIVIKPINHIARVADQVSIGNLDSPEFAETGTREVANLAASFNRMRRSLVKTMEMLKD
jgi:HAMP domain-containing protein